MSIYYFGGYKRYTTDRKNSSEIINICTLLSLPSPNHRFTDFDFVFDTPFFLSRILEKALAEAGIEYTAVGSFGFIPELIKYKARIGIFIGALLLICFTVSSP